MRSIDVGTARLRWWFRLLVVALLLGTAVGGVSVPSVAGASGPSVAGASDPMTLADGADQPAVPSPRHAGSTPPDADVASSVPSEEDPSAATDGNASTTAGAAAAAADGVIVELYPNPIAAGNEGEYLIVDLPVAGNWTLSDGYYDTPIPANVSGRVALSTAPAAASDHVDGPVRRLPEHFPLSASGDRIVLAYEGEPVDVVAYERAREAEVWNRSWEGLRGNGWRPYGYQPHGSGTDEPASTRGSGSARSMRPTNRTAEVEAFVLPDASDAPLSAVEGAEDRLFLAGYTLSSTRIAEELIAAHRRGVTVRVLVEGDPVGGFSAGTARTLDRLADAGIEPRVLAGPRSRFAYHHPKYAVVDGRAVVLTENWKPSGTGGAANRGWGVTVFDRGFADELASVFDRDATAIDAVPWTRFRENVTVHGGGRANGTYPSRFDPHRTTASNVELLLAPENAADGIVDRIDAADERVLVTVPRTAGPEWRLLEAVIRAAERGVESRVLLSNAWYDAEQNEAIAARLNDRAAAESIPLSVAVTEPRSRYAKIHAKGLVADDAVVVGSLNWNPSAATLNREVLVAFESASAADYFHAVFAADWRGGSVQFPIGLAGGLAAVGSAAWILVRREVSFT
ncbi:phospholipase D-like domain-containing protein [Halopenitus persicus]|uniref:Phosphatidylserine/phosphatidylglycerophosphate/cardiolipin synthase n=1 Tax=Halopenitus persicus TaxID=1048396 RepID=A0A1H3H5D8_9EURY|nr:phospholipase D-like domain-containing protein [Halopenitus persicus]SDY10627.1 Phosphatidylserine/phosphatidylglycerophosphate/cardiolipin synthase [Halopenitus persicus]